MDKATFDAVYPKLAHALQSGVQATFELDQTDVATGRIKSSQISSSPKMLRTGINTALVEASAVAKLLMEAGVFTEDQYWGALIDGLRAEVERYEAQLSARMGTKVSLA